MEEIRENTYSVIPTLILEDEGLNSNEKLLYATISSLSNKYGYCFATNKYLAKKLGTAESSLRRWLKTLIDKGYIFAEMKYKENSKEVEERKLRISNFEVFRHLDPCSNMSIPLCSKMSIPLLKNEQDNSININNINTNKDILSSAREILEYLNQKTNSKFKPTKSTITFIAARLKEFSIDELKTMIDFKTMEWLNDNKMSKYLQPSTLFRPTNCVNYVEAARKAAAVSPAQPEKYVLSFAEILEEIDSLRNAGYTRESMIDRLRRLRCNEEDIQNALSLEGII